MEVDESKSAERICNNLLSEIDPELKSLVPGTGALADAEQQ